MMQRRKTIVYFWSTDTQLFLSRNNFLSNFKIFKTDLIKCQKYAWIFLKEAKVHTSLILNDCKL